MLQVNSESVTDYGNDYKPVFVRLTIIGFLYSLHWLHIWWWCGVSAGGIGVGCGGGTDNTGGYVDSNFIMTNTSSFVISSKTSVIVILIAPYRP